MNTTGEVILARHHKIRQRIHCDRVLVFESPGTRFTVEVPHVSRAGNCRTERISISPEIRFISSQLSGEIIRCRHLDSKRQAFDGSVEPALDFHAGLVSFFNESARKPHK
jgi:hypothetical protein